MPSRRRTWAPVGYTPIISENYRHERISVSAALTVSPKRLHLGLYLRFQPRNCQAIDMADFLVSRFGFVQG
jgi:hypothetical protein